MILYEYIFTGIQYSANLVQLFWTQYWPISARLNIWQYFYYVSIWDSFFSSLSKILFCLALFRFSCLTIIQALEFRNKIRHDKIKTYSEQQQSFYTPFFKYTKGRHAQPLHAPVPRRIKQKDTSDIKKSRTAKRRDRIRSLLPLPPILFTQPANFIPLPRFKNGQTSLLPPSFKLAHPLYIYI